MGTVEGGDEELSNLSFTLVGILTKFGLTAEKRSQVGKIQCMAL